MSVTREWFALNEFIESCTVKQFASLDMLLASLDKLLARFSRNV